MFLNCEQVEFDYVHTFFKTNQLLTGRGNMSAYLHRFRLRVTDGSCRCGLGQETEDHIRRGVHVKRQGGSKAHYNEPVWKPEHTANNGTVAMPLDRYQKVTRSNAKN